VYTLQTFPCIASSQAMVVSACYYGNSYWSCTTTQNVV